MSGRNRCTASSSTARAMSGSAAMAPRTRKSSSSRKDGKFIMQSGHQGKNAGSNDPENFGRVGADLCRSEDQRSLRRRRLPQPARRRDGSAIPARSSAAGAPTATSRTTARRAHTIRPPRRCSSSAARCIASRSPMTACSMSATVSTIASRCSRPTASSSRSSSSPRTRWPRDRRGRSLSQRTREQRFIYLTDGQNERVRIVRRDNMQELTSFGRGGRQPGEFYRRAQHRHRFQGQHLYDGDL